MKLRKFIEDNFLIDDAVTSELVPFKFRDVQAKYYDILCNDYSEKDNFDGARELDLKARKEGFTSLWLGIFAALTLLIHHPVRFLEISYKDDATAQHFRRFKNFILSFYEKDPQKWSRELEHKAFRSINEGSELVINPFGTSFYVGTASTRTGERGGNVKGVLFSEAAHFPNTGIINASEIIEGTSRMVPIDKKSGKLSGIIVQESTANGHNFWKNTWDKAVQKEIVYKPRFFGWREFYTEQEFELIKSEFVDKRLIPQEYPETPEEAFITSGANFFDKEALRWHIKNIRAPITKKEDLIYVK